LKEKNDELEALVAGLERRLASTSSASTSSNGL
ncbi:unnamed protein product, partial [Tilletia caries]